MYFVSAMIHSIVLMLFVIITLDSAYCQTSSITHTKSKNLNVSRLLM